MSKEQLKIDRAFLFALFKGSVETQEKRKNTKRKKQNCVHFAHDKYGGFCRLRFSDSELNKDYCIIGGHCSRFRGNFKKAKRKALSNGTGGKQ